jgi:hypothetical protein
LYKPERILCEIVDFHFIWTRCRNKQENQILQHFSEPTKPKKSQDSVVGIAIGYGLDDQGVGVQVPVGSRIFSSPHHPDRLWGPPSLLCNGYQRLFPRG